MSPDVRAGINFLEFIGTIVVIIFIAPLVRALFIKWVDLLDKWTNGRIKNG